MIKSRIEVLDAAMGTALIEKNIELPLPLWSAHSNIEFPEIILEIHKSNIINGADYITTNTFRTTPRAYFHNGISKKDAIIKSKKSLIAAVDLAKKAGAQYMTESE